MGLLDDAIREHLELKRLRGADPGAVAREEHEALGPISRGGEADAGGGEESEPETLAGSVGSFAPNRDTDEAADSHTAGQETVEINMEAELAAKADPGYERETGRPARAAPVEHPGHTQAATEESLEWEIPSEHGDDPSSGAARSQRETDSRVSDHQEAGKHIEDVLEETPDFLRDTPEQERLWFEQRPPRDFDFNE